MRFDEDADSTSAFSAWASSIYISLSLAPLLTVLDAGMVSTYLRSSSSPKSPEKPGPVPAVEILSGLPRGLEWPN